MSAEHRSLLDIACTAAREAGAAILEVYRQDFAVRHKADKLPVTRADERAEAIIAQRLAAATPNHPGDRRGALRRAWPARHRAAALLAGRSARRDQEFIRRNGEFTVNIALVEGDRAVLGVVHVPSQDVTYAAADRATRQRGDGAPQPIAARPVPPRGAVVVHSRSHANDKRLTEYVATLANAERRLAGSALKFCLLAAGEADLYPRFGPTAEWDTAAGQAVLEAAGGTVTALDGAPLRYGKPGFCNPDFIARGSVSPKG